MNDHPELQRTLSELFDECPTPFVLDEDNKDHVVVKDCCGGEIFSPHLPMIGVNVFAQKRHLRARLIARVLVELSKEGLLCNAQPDFESSLQHHGHHCGREKGHLGNHRCRVGDCTFQWNDRSPP